MSFWILVHTISTNLSKIIGVKTIKILMAPNIICTIFLLNLNSSVQFSSVTQLCPTLCDPMYCSTQGLPVHHQLSEFTQTRPLSQWCHPTVSSSVNPFSSCPQSFPASGSFPVSWLITSLAKVLELQHHSFQWSTQYFKKRKKVFFCLFGVRV